MIPKAQSLYLDLVRVIAALGVFLWHASQPPESLNVMHVPDGHGWVIVFFVLSGYVIAASASQPSCTWLSYSADRISRLSCVVIPALLLTYLLDWVGMKADPGVYSWLVSPDHQFIKFWVNFFYLQQHWFFCSNPSSNAPFWSIAYEFWYYAIFAAWFFIKKRHFRWVVVPLLCLFVGPKILLLFPSWLVGVSAFRFKDALKLKASVAWMVYTVSWVPIIYFLSFARMHDSIQLQFLGPLFRSSNFVNDNIFAIFIGINFWSFGKIAANFELPDKGPAQTVIREASKRTFSLYLYHVPILLFIRAISHYDYTSPFAICSSIGITLIVVFILSQFTEQYHPMLKPLARKLFNRGYEFLRVRFAGAGQRVVVE